MRNLPPGRTARLWLKDRLGAASRAVDVLEQKTHALVGELRRLRQLVEETEDRWTAGLREADRWYTRAAVIGGSPQLGLARTQVRGSVDAQIGWRSLMGVTYPAEVSLQAPDTAGMGIIARTSALAFAARAYAQAVQSALEYAAAARALALVEEELRLTQRRLRGLNNRWIPSLRETLRDVELRLAEEEREEMIRSKWAAARQREHR